MNDFIKIFIALCALVAAFLFGRSYGEKGYRDSEEYRSLVKANEELNFAKNELENVKIKFQNIVDTSSTKKTDELLGQILTVFLADLGLRIQDKAVFQKTAETPAEPVTVIPTTSAAPSEKPPAEVNAIKPPEKSPTEEAWTKAKTAKLKASEWMIVNSDSERNALNSLKKVQIKSLNSFLSQAELGNKEDCAEFLGSYKGSVKDINNKYFGSFEFEFKSGLIDAKEQYYGKMAWYNNENSFSEKIGNNCGKSQKGLSGRVFSVSKDRYIQIYKVINLDKIGGNFYELLPNGTTKIIGSFVLGRVDKF